MIRIIIAIIISSCECFITLGIHKSVAHICVGLFLDFVFCSTDLCVYFSAGTILF